MTELGRFAVRVCNYAHFKGRQFWRSATSPFHEAFTPPTARIHRRARLVQDRLTFHITDELRSQILAAAREHSGGRFSILEDGWRSYRISYPSGDAHASPWSNIESAMQATAPADLLEEMLRRWRFLSPDHIPLDWTVDGKTGGRWGCPWARPDRIAPNEPHSDIKVPWELGRLQHLPVLSLAASIDPDNRDSWAGTYRSHVLDFSSRNPPGRGVQWMCTMDASIRVANICLGYDLLLTSGWNPDRDFEDAFPRIVLEHVRWIWRNLETSVLYTANHYLANLAGLLVAIAWLPPGLRPAGMYDSARDDFLEQCRRQFHEDGSNFEASSGYHRLSTEMAAWGISMILRVDDGMSSIPPDIIQRIHRAGTLLSSITCPDGGSTLIGDFDSGRFLRCVPAWLPGTSPPVENPRDFRDCVAGIDALFGISRNIGNVDPITPILIAPSRHLEIPEEEENSRSSWPPDREFPGHQYEQIYSFEFLGESLLESPDVRFYPGMGVAIVRSARLFLVFRCGDQGVNGWGGHAHCDLLAIELWVDGSPKILDPGTFCYSCDLETRNRWRSIQAHWAPQPKSVGEPSKLTHPFRLGGRWEPVWHRASLPDLCAEHRAWNVPVRRRVRIEYNRITITDSSPVPLLRLPNPIGPHPWTGNGTHFAIGYGRPPSAEFVIP